jgi:hypothetical protein
MDPGSYRRRWARLGYRGRGGNGGPDAGPVQRAARRSGYWQELLVALALSVVVMLLGLPLGVLWSVLAPHTPAVMTAQGPVYEHPNGEQPIGAEGTYVLLMLGAGLVLAILAWTLLGRYRGVAVLLALGLGGLGAGLLTSWYGHRIGRTTAPVGAHFDAAVNLRVREVGLWHGFLPYARGDVLFLSLAAILIYVLLAGFSPYPSLRRPSAEELAEELPVARWTPTGSVGAAGDGKLGQWYRDRPDVAQQGDLPAQKGPFGP